MLNTIAQVKTVQVNGPNGPANAIMTAVNIDDAPSAESFVATVAEQFKLHRMTAPPETSMLLITLIGPLTADRFASKWREIEKADEVVGAFMSLMVMADVIQGSKSGQQLSKVSLAAARPTP
jgi:hypothetical protein